MLQLLAIIVAIIVGYSVRSLPLSNQRLNQTLFYIVFLILFVMGYELGSNRASLVGELAQLSKTVAVFTVTLFAFNFWGCFWLLRRYNRHLRKPLHATQNANFISFARESGKYVIIILCGMLVGALVQHPLQLLSGVISALLFVLLFIIGHQMRLGGVALHSVFINRYGLAVSLVIIVSSLCGGAISALILGIPLNRGLMLSSGFGWYTLSSILTGNLINQNYGAMAFFIDFIREVIAIILVPSLGQRYPATLVGYCGGTAMDFSLPVIKQNLHEECILLAISSGMILSIANPLLISLFAKF